MTELSSTSAPPTLVARYGPSDLDLLEPGARRRFVPEGAGWETVAPQVAWELCYRKEPELYDRLVAGEAIHPAVVARLPRAARCVEVAAGTGRLTRHLVAVCERVVAIEPAAPLRSILAERLPQVEARSGYFDDTGLSDDAADLVVSCSAFTSDDVHGGERGLAELERICAPGGTIAFVWPAGVDWLMQRGFTYERFDASGMAVDFGTPSEAVGLAAIFYPHAVEEIARRGSALVPYPILGINPPCDIAWRRT